MRMKFLLHQLFKNVVFFFLLFFGETKDFAGGARTDCEVTDTVLKCKFSENINSSRTDFSVYFLPEKGREVLLVECAWLGEKFHCIKQEGFTCEQPVSDSAVIVVLPQIVHRPGSYRCAASGSQARDTRTCRFHERPTKRQLAACEVNSILGGQQAVLKCRFSFRVYAFSVQQSTSAHILIPAVVVLAVLITSLSVAVPALIIRRKIKKNRERNSSNTTDSLIYNSVTQEKTTGLRARARQLWGYANRRKLERVG